MVHRPIAGVNAPKYHFVSKLENASAVSDIRLAHHHGAERDRTAANVRDRTWISTPKVGRHA